MKARGIEPYDPVATPGKELLEEFEKSWYSGEFLAKTDIAKQKLDWDKVRKRAWKPDVLIRSVLGSSSDR